MRILICDDNADAAQTLGALLGAERHETFICHDGRSCTEKALEWKPEVALLEAGYRNEQSFVAEVLCKHRSCDRVAACHAGHAYVTLKTYNLQWMRALICTW